MSRRKHQKDSNIYIKAIKAALVAVAITVAAIMIFAFIVKENDIQNDSINIFNQMIKIHGIILSAVFAVKKLQEKQVKTAFLASLMYILICMLSFSLIQNTFCDIKVLLSDALLAAGIGVAVGFLFSKISFGHKNAKTT